MAKLNTYVHVHDADGVSHEFGPGSKVPGWAAELITNPDVWAKAPAKVEDDDSADDAKADDTDDSADADESEKVELPEGDITDAWTVKQLKAYAKDQGIDLADAKTKADILSKIAE